MREDIARFYERRKRRLMARGLRYDGKRDKLKMDDWDESQHPRAKDGKFTAGSGEPSDAQKAGKKAPEETPLPSAKSIGFKPRTKSLYRNIRDSLVARHKALRQQQGLDGVPDCTVDPDTGKMVTFNDGFQVSFQTSVSEGEGDGAVSDEEYDKVVNELRQRTGSKPYVGVFDEAETSFYCTSRRQAMIIAKQYNQMSVLNWKEFNKYKDIPMEQWTPEIDKRVFIPNPHYDPSKNHVKGM